MLLDPAPLNGWHKGKKATKHQTLVAIVLCTKELTEYL